MQTRNRRKEGEQRQLGSAPSPSSRGNMVFYLQEKAIVVELIRPVALTGTTSEATPTSASWAGGEGDQRGLSYRPVSLEAGRDEAKYCSAREMRWDPGRGNTGQCRISNTVGEDKRGWIWLGKGWGRDGAQAQDLQTTGCCRTSSCPDADTSYVFVSWRSPLAVDSDCSAPSPPC